MRRVALLFVILTIAAIPAGCALKDKTYTPNQAEQKLIDFCKKEGRIDITVRAAGKTEWIYLALEEPLFEIKVDPNRKGTKRRIMPFSLLSLEGEFDNRTFSFNYDVVPNVLSPEPTSYGSSYNENYTKKRQLIYQGLQETFFNLTKEGVNKDEIPVFFVIVIADITKGLATKNTIYLDDLKAYLTEAIPFEEYYLREVNDIIGDKNLIGDKKGLALDYDEITWPDFLTDQIKARIRFKFTQSDFPPETDPDNQILTIAANTLRIYPFLGYDSLYLYNLREKREMIFNKEQLKIFEEQASWEKEKGKTTVIHFEPLNTPPGDKTGTRTDDKK